jgi:hypothetical protein
MRSAARSTLIAIGIPRKCAACPRLVYPNERQHDAATFGLVGVLCTACCRQRRKHRRTGRIQVCDLCEDPTSIAVISGGRFEVDGRVCRPCWDELKAEHAAETASLPRYVGVPGTSGHSGIPRSTQALAVLDARFTLDDLTPRAFGRLLVPVIRRLNRGNPLRKRDVAVLFAE